MTDPVTVEPYGVLTAPDTLMIQRVLPGPIERVWSYLTEGDLRRRWLAAGEMEMALGGTVELVWRNDELTDPPGQRPPGASEEHRMQSRITELDPPRKLAITWGEAGAVSFELAPQGSQVLLTLTHSGVPDRSTLLSVSSGWHVHLDILGAVLGGERPEPFWDRVFRLKGEYERRLAA